LFKSELLIMRQVVDALQPGPLKTTTALFGSKPLPMILNVNACEPAGGSGNVVSEFIRGIAVVPETANVRPVDGFPLAPFCTVTVKLPPVRVAVPFSCVELALVSALFGMTVLAMTQGMEFVQLGALKITIALFGSKAVPAIENVKACPVRGGFGMVVIELS